MARYNKEFKMLCIQKLKANEPLPEVEGIKPTTIYTYARLWRLLPWQLLIILFSLVVFSLTLNVITTIVKYWWHVFIKI